MTESPITFSLPALGDDVEEATISRWLAAPGDSVDIDDPLVEVATDKVDTEIPSPCTGTLVEIVVAEGETAATGAALATLVVKTTSHTQAGPAVQSGIESAPTPASDPDSTPQTQRPLDSISRVHTSGGVSSAAIPAVVDDANSGPDTSVEKLSRIRQTIAKRMMHSLQSSAQLTSVIEADVTAVAALRTEHKQRFAEQRGTPLSFLPFFAKATLEALNNYPLLTTRVNDDCTEIAYPHAVNLGIAVDSPKGLMVPVIRDAVPKGIGELALEIADLAEKVRSGTISPDALTGGHFTITNTGSRGALFDTPILNHPQVGILGTGAVVERVVPWRDVHGSKGFTVRSMVYLAATYDHRVVDGADAARFLSAIKNRLESGFTEHELFDSGSA